VTVAIAPEFAPRVRRDEPLSRHTSWHVGGPAEVFFNPRDRTELAAFLRTVPTGVPIQFRCKLSPIGRERRPGTSGVCAPRSSTRHVDQNDRHALFAEGAGELGGSINDLNSRMHGRQIDNAFLQVNHQ